MGRKRSFVDLKTYPAVRKGEAAQANAYYYQEAGARSGNCIVPSRYDIFRVMVPTETGSSNCCARATRRGQ